MSEKENKEIRISGIVNSTETPEEWVDDFLAWLESRGEFMGGGVQEHNEKKEEFEEQKQAVAWFRKEFPELVFFLLNLIASHEKNDLLSLEEENFREMFKEAEEE